MFALLHTAEGVALECEQNDMVINLPKSLLRGVDRHHIILMDRNCRAYENETHFILQTQLIGCKTQLRHRGNFAIYSNMVTEIPLEEGQIVTRVRDIAIPFQCFYSELGVVSSIGIKPVSKKVITSARGMGKFTLTLDLYRNSRLVNLLTKLWKHKDNDWFPWHFRPPFMSCHVFNLVKRVIVKIHPFLLFWKFASTEPQMKRTHSESVFITNVSVKYKCNYGVLSLIFALQRNYCSFIFQLSKYIQPRWISSDAKSSPAVVFWISGSNWRLALIYSGVGMLCHSITRQDCTATIQFDWKRVRI